VTRAVEANSTNSARSGRGERPDTHRILRSSAVVGVGTALSRATGFLRVAAIAYALGVSTLAGVYSYANETPNIVYELLLGGVLTATLVPLFVKHVEDGDEEATSAVVTIAVLALIAITIVGELLAPLIVRLYTIDVSGHGIEQQRELATQLLRCFMPQMFFYGLVALATAMLQARRRFAAAAFAPILNNVVVIALFLVLPQLASRPITVPRVLNDTGLMLLIGLGTTAGIAAMALALWPALKRARVHLHFVPKLRHAAVRTMLRLSGWTVGYVIANQIALWVVLVLANGKRGGAFAYLAAYAFFQLPHGLFAVSIMTTVQPELAFAVARGDRPALRHRFARGLRLILVVVIPAAGLYVGLARPIVVALLQRGAFSAHDASLVADTLIGFGVGLPAFSAYLYVLRGYYSLHDTRTPFALNCFENAVNVGLALVLYPAFGIPGLAWAFSGAYTVAALLTMATFSRRIGGLRGRQVGTTVVRVSIVGLAVTGATWGVSRAIGWSTPASAIVATVAGAIVALVVSIVGLRLLHVEELDELASIFRRRPRAKPDAAVSR
jgi:putative peptidoglycan lipid II flippase